MKHLRKSSLICALLLTASWPAAAQTFQSPEERRAQSDQAMQNQVQSTHQELGQVQNGLAEQHAQSQQLFQPHPLNRFPQHPPGYIPMPNPNAAPKKP